MRFLADENVEQPVVDALRAAGNDVTCVGEVAPGARDQEVLRLANAESRLLLTNDKDFGEAVYREGRTSEGIVLLRLRTEDGVEKAATVAKMLLELERRLAGHFAVLTDERVRLRPLRRL
jgi:predicted nuclease of predicted toxin-antitoxin system